MSVSCAWKVGRCESTNGQWAINVELREVATDPQPFGQASFFCPIGTPLADVYEQFKATSEPIVRRHYAEKDAAAAAAIILAAAGVETWP